MDSFDQQQNLAPVIVPVIAIDLDGVVWHQGKFIEGSAETIQMLTKDLNLIDKQKYSSVEKCVKLPFFFLTNSGANTEQHTANLMNSKLSLDESQKISHEHFILNYTPLKEEMRKFSDKIVLVSGFDSTADIMTHCELHNYITAEEYAKLYPQLVPNNKFGADDTFRTKQIVAERLKFEDHRPFDKYIQIHAIFLSYISHHVEIVTQIVCDLLSTHDGNIANGIPDDGPISHIPIYSIANDYFFPTRDSPMVRLGWGMYMDAIEGIYRKAFNKQLDVVRCGKPSLITFGYAQFLAQEFTGRSDLQISKFYMIGDNPHTDIRGAHQLGWETILVKTGVYKDGQKIRDKEEQPTVIVENLREAIKYIFEKENINYRLD